MFTCLSPGAIGISAGLERGIQLAKDAGFQGVEVPIGEVANLLDEIGTERVDNLFRKNGILPGGWGLPVEWRSDEERWRKDLEQLPRLAKAGQAIGCVRTATWVMPCSNSMSYSEYWDFAVARFTPIAKILRDHGCSLGLEFIGPKTLWTSQKYEFVHTMDKMLELGAAIGPNVGLLLDCWHWYTAHHTVAEVEALKPEQVVYVHVNDAPVGIPVDEQIDSVRDLPGATGVIDLVGFLRGLKKIGYQGPITPEPFHKPTAALPAEEAARVTAAALNKVWSQI